jgi:molecular chaperone GrpE (heat shock protein)
MMTIEVNEECMEKIAELEKQIVEWKSRMLNKDREIRDGYEKLISTNQKMIDGYSILGIDIFTEIDD